MGDIIWAVVAIYTASVAAWLAYTFFNRKALDALARKNDERLLEHERRVSLVEKGLVASQRELVVARDAITRIENSLMPGPSNKAKPWPGEG